MNRQSTPDKPEGTATGEEVDNQFRSVMEGLRTTIPGVMVLFSFLLLLPLQTAFNEISGVNRIVFYVAFTSAAISSVLLIAPSVHQRVRAPITGIKRHTWSHVMFASNVALAGTVTFLVSIVAVVYLISSLVFTVPLAIAATVIATIVAVWAWFYVPLVTFSKGQRK